MPKQVQRQDVSPACSWSAEWLPQIYCYTVIVRWAEKQWVCVRLQVGRLWLTQTLPILPNHLLIGSGLAR